MGHNFHDINLVKNVLHQFHDNINLNDFELEIVNRYLFQVSYPLPSFVSNEYTNTLVYLREVVVENQLKNILELLSYYETLSLDAVNVLNEIIGEDSDEPFIPEHTAPHFFLKGGGVHSKDNNCYTEILDQVEKELFADLSTRMPSLESLAAKFNITASTLKRHFKAKFGKSIYEYYITKKMEFAKELLQKGKSASEVAFILGYNSISHFIEMFKRAYGRSPNIIE